MHGYLPEINNYDNFPGMPNKNWTCFLIILTWLNGSWTNSYEQLQTLKIWNLNNKGVQIRRKYVKVK